MTTIEKIKAYYKIQRIAAQFCGGLGPSGHSRRYLIGWCPQCQQKRKKHERPRFWVDTELQLCNCFKPGCMGGKPMDVINLYAKLHGLDNDGAIANMWAERTLGL